MSTPDSSEQCERRDAGEASRRHARASETVLLVEDEEAVRVTVRRILQKFGYTVIAAHHGAEALEVAERHEGRIDLLLTDMVMPVMNGRALLERFEARWPQTRILCMSGYTEDTLLRDEVRETRRAFIPKPFTVDELLAKVRDVLDAPAGGAPPA